MDSFDVPCLLDVNKTIAGEFLMNLSYPWLAFPALSTLIKSLGIALDPDAYERIGEDIWISRKASVAKSASLSGPLIVDHEAEIRHCAYIRGSAVIGKGAIVGNSTEVKNSILFDRAQAPHFNYVGDSILGYAAHLGAGSITSNLKSDKTGISVKNNGERIETGLRKFGALIGDRAEIGCNCVLNPGSIVGRNATIYPQSSVRGVVPEDSIYKSAENIVKKTGGHE